MVGVLKATPGWHFAQGVPSSSDRLDFGVFNSPWVGKSQITYGARCHIDDYTAATDNDPRILCKQSSTASGNHEIMVGMIATNAIRIRLQAGGSTITAISANNVWPDNETHWVIVTYDGATIRLYLDENEITSGDFPASKTGTLNAVTSSGLRLGNGLGGNLNYQGYAGEAFIDDAVWEPERVKRVVQGAYLGDNLVAPYFHIDPRYSGWAPVGRSRDWTINNLVSYPGMPQTGFVEVDVDTKAEMPNGNVAPPGIRTRKLKRGFIASLTVVGGVTINVPLKTFSLTEQAPIVGSGASVDVPLKSFNLSELVPLVGSGASIIVPVKTFDIATQVPLVGSGVGIIVPLKTFNIVALIPTIEAGSAGPTIIVPLKAFNLAEQIPEVGSGVSLEVPLKSFNIDAKVPVITADPAVTLIEVPLKQFSLAFPKILVTANDPDAEDFDLNLTPPVEDLEMHNYLVENFDSLRRLLTSGDTATFTTTDGKTVVVQGGMVKQIV